MTFRHLFLLFGLFTLFATQAPAQPRVLVLLADGFNADEFWRPYFLLKGAGATLTIASTEKGVVKAGSNRRELDVEANLALDSVQLDLFDALFIPGGGSPARLVNLPHVQRIVQQFGSQKPMAAICHGPMLLAKAGLLKGGFATYLPEVRQETVHQLPPEAFGHYLDQPVVRTRNLIMSRYPDDAEAFSTALLGQLFTQRKSAARKTAINFYGCFQDPKAGYALRRGSLKALDVEARFESGLTKGLKADVHVIGQVNPTKKWVQDTLMPFCKTTSGRIFLYSPNPVSGKGFTQTADLAPVFEHLMQEKGSWFAENSMVSNKTVFLYLLPGFSDWEYQTVHTLVQATGYQVQAVSRQETQVKGLNGTVVQTTPFDAGRNENWLILLPGDKQEMESLLTTETGLTTRKRTLVFGEWVLPWAQSLPKSESLTVSAPDPLKWSFPKRIKWSDAPYTQTLPGLYTVKDLTGLGRFLFAELK